MDRNIYKETFLAQIITFSQAVIWGPMAIPDFPWTAPAQNTHEKPLTLNQIAQWPNLFIDGGVKHKSNIDPLTCLSLGDGDSTNAALDLSFSPDKDSSDLALGLQLIPSQITSLYLFGFSGGRQDHEIANWGEIANYLENRGQASPCQVFIDQNKLCLSAGVWNLNINQVFSLFSFGPTEITLTGDCRYQLTKPTNLKPFSSYGLSNLGHGTIQLTTAHPILVVLSNWPIPTT